MPLNNNDKGTCRANGVTISTLFVGRVVGEEVFENFLLLLESVHWFILIYSGNVLCYVLKY